MARLRNKVTGVVVDVPDDRAAAMRRHGYVAATSKSTGGKKGASETSDADDE